MDTSENEWLHQPFEGKACHQNEPYRLDKKDNNGQEVARKPRESATENKSRDRLYYQYANTQMSHFIRLSHLF